MGNKDYGVRKTKNRYGRAVFCGNNIAFLNEFGYLARWPIPAEIYNNAGGIVFPQVRLTTNGLELD